MGYGSYSHDAHLALIRDRSHLSDEKVFAQRSCHALMSPKGVRVRESRDSAEHPNSFGVVFALDVTGSMGEIPRMLARQQLPRFMKILTDSGYGDAQVLFAAVGDATCDAAPLQVGQFESTAELMDRWLTWSFLEGGGGGQEHESYELALYFLAEHTEMDCFVKRKKRGYLFMTGDELPYPSVSRAQVDALIGDRLDEDIPLAEVVAVLQETFHPFFMIPDLGRRKDCERAWRDALGDHVVCLESPEDTCFAAAGLIALTEGKARLLEELGPILEKSGAPRERVSAILRALTPYAATLGRDGAPLPKGLTAGLKRLLGG